MGGRFSLDLGDRFGQIGAVRPDPVPVRAQVPQIDVRQFMAQHRVGGRFPAIRPQHDPYFPGRVLRPAGGHAPARLPHGLPRDLDSVPLAILDRPLKDDRIECAGSLREQAETLRQRRPVGVGDVIDHQDRRARGQDDHPARLILDRASEGIAPMPGRGEVGRQWILEIHQHVVERRILPKPRDKFDGVRKRLGAPEAPAANEQVVKGGLVFGAGIASPGQGGGDRSGIQCVKQIFALRLGQVRQGAQFIQDALQNVAGRPAGLPLQILDQLVRGPLPPANPLLDKLLDLRPDHFARRSRMARTLPSSASGWKGFCRNSSGWLSLPHCAVSWSV